MSHALLKAAEVTRTCPVWQRYVQAFHAYEDAKGQVAKHAAESRLLEAKAAWDVIRLRRYESVGSK